MRRRRIAQLIAAGLIAAALAASGWEFFQIGRRLPEETAARADRIVVEKAARRLTLVRGDAVLARYDVALGGDPIGPKHREGDGRTPEGTYTIDFKNAHSRFHLALRISYPNAADGDNARRRGVPPGGDIMIHGLPNGLGWLRDWHLLRDWTDGCIAVTNAQIEEIWAAIDVGTPVEIKP